MASLARLCREQDFPAALLDRELSVRWCTPSAASRWPLLGRPEGMRILFPGLCPEPGRVGRFGAPPPWEELWTLLLPWEKGWLALFPGERPARGSLAATRQMDALSWQFRQPLGEMTGALSLLEARLAAQGVSGWEKACAQACQSANRLLRGWENLSLVLGGESPRLEPLSLWEETESLLEAARLAVPPPRLRLEWRFPREEAVVLADRRWLERVLCNLLSNGCLFGGGELSVRGKKTGGQGMVTVRDRGPGLPPGLEQGEPPAPGELFCREGLPRSGAGLGLCACRRAVGVLGGRFLLSSGKEGAAFSFSLPLDPAGRRPEPPPAPADYLHSRLSPLMVGLSDLLSPL